MKSFLCTFLVFATIYTAIADTISIPDSIPKVTISSSASNPTYENPLPLKVSYSELVDGFSTEDINVTNGTISSFERAIAYSATLGPDLANNESLFAPRAVTFDQQGNMYIADALSHSVKIFNANNNLIHTIGSGRSGSGEYEFNTPEDLIIDQKGYLIVADAGNRRIQIFDNTLNYIGTIGSGNSGSSNNEFNDPLGIDIDDQGRLFVADASNHRIQVFDSFYHYLATIGGFGSETGKFNHTSDVAVDSEGNIYAVDRFNHRIQIFDSNFDYINSIGGSEPGSSPDLFDRPMKITINSQGHVIVSDDGNLDIRVFDSKLNSLGIIGNTGFQGDDPYSFNFPLDVAVDINDNIYCVDDKDVIKMYDTNYQFIKTIDGGLSGKEDDAFQTAHDITLDESGRIYIADLFGNRVQVYDSTFNFIKTFGTGTSDYNRIYSPRAVTTDTKGYIYISNDDHILVYDQTHTYQAKIDPPEWYSVEESNMFFPESITVDDQGRIYLCDTQNHRILIYNPDYTYFTSLGTGIHGSSNDQFTGPQEITTDRLGNLYVADEGNARIQIFNNNLQYVKSLYPPVVEGSYSSRASHVAVDSIGNIYVSSWVNKVVLVFNKDFEQIATIGIPNATGADNESFSWPRDIAIDANNQIYIADGGRVQRYEALTDYLLNVVPAEEGEIQLGIAAGVAIDATGNPNEAAEQFSTMYDLQPEVVLSDIILNKENQTGIVTIRFSEPVSNFSVSDITIKNCTINSLQTTDSTSFLATIAPTQDGEILISIPKHVVFDASGQGNIESHPLTFEYDATLPKATFSSEYGSHTKQSPLSIDLLFSEPVSILSVDDLKLTNASVSSFRPAEPEYISSIGTDLTNKDDYIKYPSGIAYDSKGYLFVAASYANQIKIYDQSMALVKAIGDGTTGKGDYQFKNLSDIFIDGNGNIYVVDGGNHRVQIYDHDRNYLATLGSSEAGSSVDHFNDPSSVTVDSEGRIFVADRLNQRIQVFDAERNYLHTLGNVGIRGSQNNQFNNPIDLAISDNGFIYVVDQFNQRVQVFTPQFQYHGTLGTTGIAGSGNNQFNYPNNVAIDAEGNIYVTDGNKDQVKVYSNDFIYTKSLTISSPTALRDLIITVTQDILYSNDLQLIKFDQEGNLLLSYGSDGADSSDYTFNQPVRTAVDFQHRLFVADEKNNRVQVFDQDLNLIHSLIGIKGSTTYDKFTNPTDVAVDNKERVFIADGYNRTVHIYDSAFSHIETISLQLGSSGSNSFGIDVDKEGKLFIADTYSNVVLVYDQNFEYQATLGTGNSGSGTDQFNYPADVAVDEAGNIYVTDVLNNRVQVFDSNLIYISTIDYTEYGGYPFTLELDIKGNIYVSRGGGSIEVFTNAGDYFYSFGEEKGLNEHGFISASGISIDESGLIYIADRDSHSVRTYRPQYQYNLEISPISDGEVIVELLSNVTTDWFGNGNEATQFNLIYDSTGPVASLGSNDSISNEPRVQVDIAFNEQVSGLGINSFTLSNATIDRLQTTDSTHFIAHLNTLVEGYASLTLDSATVMDALGNINSRSETLQVLYYLSKDTIAPGLEITSSERDTVEYAFAVDFVFNEKVSGFTIEDIVFSNASFGNLETTDSIVFTTTITPLATGTVNLSIAENAVIDMAGNANPASEIFSWYYIETYNIQIVINTEDGSNTGAYRTVLYEKKGDNYTNISNLENLESDTIEFANLSKGEYTVGIQPLDVGYLTTYLGDKLFLHEAKIINLDQDIQSTIILHNINSETGEGTSTILGILLRDEQTEGGRLLMNTSQTTGISLANVTVYLLEANTEEVIAVDITNSEGVFSFSNLSEGEYLIMADYEGLPNDKQSNRIQILPQTELINLTAVVGTNVKVTVMQEEKQITSIAEADINELAYGPNPVIDYLRVKVDSNWLGGQVIIRDSMGKVVFRTKLVDEISVIDFSSMTSGFYLVSILKDSRILSFKVTR